MLARWNPWDELQQLERQMSDLSRRAFGTIRVGPFGTPESIAVPAVDVFTRDGDLVVRVELPGVDPDHDIDVSVQDGVLVIRGERRLEERAESEGYWRRESVHGAFHRSIPLPSDVKEDDISAFYDNGILEVVVPGGARSTSRKEVPISVGNRVRALISTASRKR